MTSAEIKLEATEMYLIIQETEKRLADLRLICKHENKFEGNYSYRVGNIQPAIICDDCGELINYI